jgi:hypothetical protein
MKKVVAVLITCCFGSVGAIIVLSVLSREMIYDNNSFIRVFPSHAVEQQDNFIELKYSSYYIAGTDKNHVYLGNYFVPLHLMIANSTLTDTQRVHIKIKDLDKLKFRSISVRVDSPYFYVTDGVMPGVFRGSIDNWEAERFINNSVYFSAAEPITPNSFALRAKSSQTQEDFLLKQSKRDQFSKDAVGLLEKQIDGVFCTDGMLTVASEINKIVYTYFYRNQFIVTDTSMNLEYRANTIDTVTRAKLKIVQISSGNSTTLANPSAIVNRRACIWKKWLLVNSNLMSKNDTKAAFAAAAVIDVYDLEARGQYKFSFRLFDHDKKRTHHFLAGPERLYVINGSKLISYKPNKIIFQQSEPH